MTRRGFGPRVRRLHARIGRAHHQAEGMVVSRSLLAGTATPLQLAALIRALMPAYDQLEALAPLAATSLGDSAIPWGDLARRPALEEDRASLAALPATPSSPALDQWLARLQQLAATLLDPPSAGDAQLLRCTLQLRIPGSDTCLPVPW